MRSNEQYGNKKGHHELDCGTSTIRFVYRRARYAYPSVTRSKNINQLSPEREVNSGVEYRDVKRRGIYLALFTDLEGDSCFSIYQISWIKIRKVTFCKEKTPFS